MIYSVISARNQIPFYAPLLSSTTFIFRYGQYLGSVFGFRFFPWKLGPLGIVPWLSTPVADHRTLVA